MAEDQDEGIEEIVDTDSELDPLAGQELFEIPDDLLELESTGAQTAEGDADADKAPPAIVPVAEKTRDPVTGKYVPKAAAPATEEAQPPEPAQAGAPAPGEPPAEALEEPELEFSFRADGTAIPVKGSKLTKDWLMIPRQYAGDVQKLMSHGVVYSGSFRRKLAESAQEVANMRAEVRENEEKAKKFLEFYADLADRQEKGEMDDNGRSPLEAWLDDFGKNRVKLEAQADLPAAKAFRERKPAGPVKLDGFDDEPDARGAPAGEPDFERYSEELAPVVTDRITALAKTPEFRGLSGAELTRIRDYMGAPANIGRFFMEVQQVIPAAEWGGNRDLQPGERVVIPAFAQEFAYHAKTILDARKSALELAAAETKNAAANGNKIPPTTAVDGAGAAPGKGSKVPPKFKNKAEMDAWFNASAPLS